MTENLSPSEPDPDVARERMLDDRIDADAIGAQLSCRGCGTPSATRYCDGCKADPWPIGRD